MLPQYCSRLARPLDGRPNQTRNSSAARYKRSASDRWESCGSLALHSDSVVHESSHPRSAATHSRRRFEAFDSPLRSQQLRRRHPLFSLCGSRALEKWVVAPALGNSEYRPQFRRNSSALVSRARELGTALVVVTHATEIAARMQRVLVLESGRLRDG